MRKERWGKETGLTFLKPIKQSLAQRHDDGREPNEYGYGAPRYGRQVEVDEVKDGLQNVQVGLGGWETIFAF